MVEVAESYTGNCPEKILVSQPLPAQLTLPPSLF